MPWRTVATPYAAFAVAVIGFQLLLPSMLFPDNGDGPKYILDRLGDYTGVLTEQLGLGPHPAIGVAVLVLAGAGMVVGVHPPARGSTSRWPPSTVLASSP